MRHKTRSTAVVITAMVLALVMSSCSGIAAFGEQFNRAMHGVPATMTTYDQYGAQIDQVHGTSFQITRDKRFDSTNSDGSSNEDSSVLMISVGHSHISHVGSTLVLAQDGLTKVSDAPTSVELQNSTSGHPWLNNFFEYNRNLWKGKAKTIMVRSQNGNPIAVYAGDEVEILATDVPKSTWFRVDGKYLFVYRADYTVYDNDLLQ